MQRIHATIDYKLCDFFKSRQASPQGILRNGKICTLSTTLLSVDMKPSTTQLKETKEFQPSSAMTWVLNLINREQLQKTSNLQGASVCVFEEFGLGLHHSDVLGIIDGI